MKKFRLFVLMLAMVAGLIAAPVSADHQTRGGVRATVSPGIISVSVAPFDVGYGVVNLSSDVLSFAEPSGQECDLAAPFEAFTATNTGSIDAEFNIRGNDSFQLEGSLISVFQSFGTGSQTRVIPVSQGTNLANGDFVRIQGSTNYNGFFVITDVASNVSFVIDRAFNSGEVSGLVSTWSHGLASGSAGTGWDLVGSGTAVENSSGDEYAHQYTTHGGNVSADPTACDFAGADPAKSSGGINAFANGGASLTLVTTDAPHGLVGGDTVTILTGPPAYVGTFIVDSPVPTTSDFRIPVAFTVTGTGTWEQPDDVLTDGHLSTSLSLLADSVPISGVDSAVDVFLQVVMPVSDTQGLNEQIMPVVVQASAAGP